MRAKESNRQFQYASANMYSIHHTPHTTHRTPRSTHTQDTSSLLFSIDVPVFGVEIEEALRGLERGVGVGGRHIHEKGTLGKRENWRSV